MFVLDVDMPKMTTIMFVGGMNVISYVEMWHKTISHISMQTLRNMLRNKCSGWTAEVERL